MTDLIRTNSNEVVAAGCNWMDGLSSDLRRLIDALPSCGDDELMALQNAIGRLAQMSWIAECAVDYEIMQRARRYSRDNRSGVCATALAHAEAVGRGQRVVMRNAEIYDNFRGVLLAEHPTPEDARLRELLPEKTFWLAATSALPGHMRESLEYFADQRENNPAFSVKDAIRYIREQKAPDILEIVPTMADEADVVDALKDLDAAHIRLRKLAGDRIGPLLKDQRQAIVLALNVPAQAVLTSVARLIEDGFDEVDTLASRGGWPRDHVKAWFRQMLAQGWVRAYDKTSGRLGYALTEKGQQECLDAITRAKTQSAEIQLTPGWGA